MHNTNHSPINILVISPYFFPAIGGSQRYMEELYVHITRQFPQVHVHVVTYNTERAVARERHRGISLYRIPCVELIRGQFALPNIVALLGVLQFLSKKHIDFVHTHIRFFDATWWAWIYARIIGAKSIFTEQVAAHPVHRMPQVQWIARFVDATIAKWSIAQYDLITTTNRSAKVFLEKTLGIKKQITVSY